MALYGSKRSFLLVAGFGVVLSIGAIALYVWPQSAGEQPTNIPKESPPQGAITIEGTMVCLPHKNISGPQTLECAFGILDDNGRYFGLSDTDPNYGNISGIGTNERIRVEGTFTPRSNSNYQDIGVISVTKITSLTSAKQGVQTYRSKTLGLSFLYNASDSGVVEQNNIVHVYALGTPPEQGQFVENFAKKTQETFAQSIERQVLAGYSTSTCTVVVSPNKNLPGYQQAEITYPLPSDPNESPLGHEAQCNEKYDRTNGIRYFLYDDKHPDRFYFFSIGQYPIVATGNKTWQDTVVIEN